DELKLRELELKKIVKTAILISEESCIDAFKTKSLSGDLGMQRFVFQESFKLVLADLIKTKTSRTPDFGMKMPDIQEGF
ncbi:hypothetical protein KY337_02750, partial [Candidatus Woesearchaeota archaeon]|nr:hypothetical protein [Candidatus Woesearchaeota archaeon]